MMDMQLIMYVLGGLAILLLVLSMGGSKKPVVESNAFAEAKHVLSQPRQDVETGEWYAYKLTRIAVDAPSSAAQPQISVGGKAVKS